MDVLARKQTLTIFVKIIFSKCKTSEIQYQLEKEVNRKIDIGFIDSFKPYILKNR